jgi:molybdenum cofactor cytidylyltransferase
MSGTEGAAIVLAAGASVRFGGQPKALLPIGRELAIERVVRLSREAGYSPVIAVVGPHETEIRSAVAHSPHGPDEIRVNAEWASGRTGSVHCGLADQEEAGSILLWPVDSPLASAATLQALAERRRREALGLWFLPTFHGQGGHPVLWDRSVTPRVRALRPDAPLRSILPHLGAQVVRVELPDPGVTANLNTPEEYRQALTAFLAGDASWTER